MRCRAFGKYFDISIPVVAERCYPGISHKEILICQMICYVNFCAILLKTELFLKTEFKTVIFKFGNPVSRV